MYFDESIHKDSFHFEILGIHTWSNTKKSATNGKDSKNINCKLMPFIGSNFTLLSGFASILMGSMENKLIQAQEFPHSLTICSKWSLSHALFLSRSLQHVSKHHPEFSNTTCVTECQRNKAIQENEAGAFPTMLFSRN